MQPDTRTEGRMTPRGIPAQKKSLGDRLFAPTNALAKSVHWVTNPAGGGKALFKLMAAYCFALGVESMYVSMPAALNQRQVPATERRFLPKPGVNDGADFTRLIDPGAIVRFAGDTTLGWLPFYQKSGSDKKHYVWGDQFFYFAILGSALIQAIEAMAIRKVALPRLKEKAEKLGAYKQIKPGDSSLTIARLAAAKYNHAHTGNAAATGLLILAVYAVEFASFNISSGGADAYSQKWAFYAYAFLTIFGFELFYNLSEDETEEETA